MPPRLIALACSLIVATSFAASPRLSTIAEKSGFKRTGRFAEVVRLCADFERAWPKQVRCFEFGTSPQGRPLLALAVSADGTLDATTAHEKQRTVVLMQGGIHAGEIDGKDAGFLALREMLEGRAAKDALRQATLVFVPVFNVDGHERFGRWNRPNQVGPEEMGWRTTAQNLNLNRDYTKAETPEMQAMLQLLEQWDPILLADLHVTDGAEFEHDISINVEPTLVNDDPLTLTGEQLRDDLIERLAAQGSLPINFYPSLIEDDNPQSGFAVSPPLPRFSQPYWGKRNRLAVLVETHSWKDYPTRVRITRHTIIAMMELAAAQGHEWRRIAAAADASAAKIGGKPEPLTYENTDHVIQIDFRGYAYTREPSAISGSLVTRYDNRRPQVWHVPFKDELKPAISVTAPRGGYIVPAEQALWLGEKLELHGIEFRRISEASAASEVQTFRATNVKLASSTFEGRTMLSVEGAWQPEKRDIPAGSLFVPIAQAKSHLLMALLEPQAPDSFLAWGYFNAAFERKEYLESYVAEQVGSEMLQKNPALREEFTRRLAEDPQFARSPQARLDFFYRRHESWDERVGLYPLYRVDDLPGTQ